MVIVVAMPLDLSLETVVTVEAKGLPVGPIPKEFQRSFVWDDVVNTLGLSRLASVLMEPA